MAMHTITFKTISGEITLLEPDKTVLAPLKQLVSNNSVRCWGWGFRCLLHRRQVKGTCMTTKWNSDFSVSLFRVSSSQGWKNVIRLSVFGLCLGTLLCLSGCIWRYISTFLRMTLKQTCQAKGLVCFLCLPFFGVGTESARIIHLFSLPACSWA